MQAHVRSLATHWHWLIIATALAVPFWLLVRDERTAFLAGNTLFLAAGTALFALPLGTVLAVLLVRTQLFGRRAILAVLAAMLFVPLYVQVAAWDTGFGVPGWYTHVYAPPLTTALLHHMRAAIWIHGLAATPWVMLIVGLGLALVEREQEEAALTEGTAAQVLWRITLRQAAPFVMVALLWIVISVAGEIVVTDVYQVRTYAEEIYLGYALDSYLANIPMRVLPGVLFVAWLVVAGLAVIEQVMPRTSGGPVIERKLLELRWLHGPALLFTLIALVLIAGVPLYNLVRTAGVVSNAAEGGMERTWHLSTFANMVFLSPVRNGRAFGWTLAIGGLSATAAVALAAPLAWLAQKRRTFRVLVVALAALGLAVPGPIVGLGIIWLFNWRNVPWLTALYDHSLAAPCLAALIRSLPLVLLICQQAFRSLAREPLESAALEGAGETTQFLSVALPQRWAALVLAWLVALAASMGDVAATKLVTPPGVETLGEVIFREIHMGITDVWAGLCLATVALFLFIAFLVRCSAARLSRLS